MVHEIRQASRVEEANANSIYFLATIGGKGWKIKYDCGVTQTGTSLHECVRYATEGATVPVTVSLTHGIEGHGSACLYGSVADDPQL